MRLTPAELRCLLQWYSYEPVGSGSGRLRVAALAKALEAASYAAELEPAVEQAMQVAGAGVTFGAVARRFEPTGLPAVAAGPCLHFGPASSPLSPFHHHHAANHTRLCRAGALGSGGPVRERSSVFTGAFPCYSTAFSVPITVLNRELWMGLGRPGTLGTKAVAARDVARCLVELG